MTISSGKGKNKDKPIVCLQYSISLSRSIGTYKGWKKVLEKEAAKNVSKDGAEDPRRDIVKGPRKDIEKSPTATANAVRSLRLRCRRKR